MGKSLLGFYGFKAMNKFKSCFVEQPLTEVFEDGFKKVNNGVFQIMGDQMGNWKLFFMILSIPSWKTLIIKKRARVLALKYLIGE